MEWPVYFNLGNISCTIRFKHSNHSNIVVAHLPVPPIDHFTGHGIATGTKEQQIHRQEILKKVINLVFRPLNTLFNTGLLMLCADGQMWQWYPVICAWMADCLENIHLHSVKQPHCGVYQTPKSSFGEENSSLWQLKDDWLYL
jgi:hypothetical protein